MVEKYEWAISPPNHILERKESFLLKSLGLSYHPIGLVGVWCANNAGFEL